MSRAATATDEKQDSIVSQLMSRVGPVKQAKRGKPYNYPGQYYLKPDGEVVELQGDPQNFKYYRDKGYYALTAEEAARYVAIDKPRIVSDQRRRAYIITTLRKVAEKNPTVELLADFEVMTTEELDAMLQELGARTGSGVNVIRGKLREEVAPTADTDPNAVGTEAGGADILAAKLAKAQSHPIEPSAADGLPHQRVGQGLGQGK